jgi:hypothetical protein
MRQLSIICSIIPLVCFYAQADISGHIADTTTHNSIANVKVTIMGSTTSVTTDPQGNFTLPTTSAIVLHHYSNANPGFQPVIRDNKLSINSSDNILSVSVFNSKGVRVFYNASTDHASSFQLPAFPQGCYSLSVAGADRSEIFRLIMIGGRTQLLQNGDQFRVPLPALHKTGAVTTFAVACENAAYKTREVNVVDSGVNEIRLVPSASTTYYYFPPVQLDDGIVTGTLKAASVNQTLMEAAGTKVLNKVNCHEIHSILVCRDNKLIFEEYFVGNSDTINFENNIARVTGPQVQWTRTMKHYVASATKAITSTVVGMALDKTGLTTDEKVSQFFPTYSTLFSGRKANITIKHCLNMQSGLNWNEWTDPITSDLSKMWKSQDFVDFVFSHDGRSDPGTEWVYCSGLPNVELRLVQTMLGDSTTKFIRQNLLEPLGISDINWEMQPGRVSPEGAARMFIRPRDMLKWGLTCLNGGKWAGKQIIPAAWLTTCSNVQANGNYSYHFWVKTYTYGTKTAKQYSAEGDGGNYVCIFPTLNMVVVFTGGLYLDPSYDPQIKDMLENYILPAVAP